ncbi:LysM peptidoglycan-binding domain-containing protein [Massilia violaceinigra]|uniref:LysM peptidoglycan-binding domain-containing protein n=1 Tax=Massilia violaceinigra TaxID=2045208 RepID=A0ABY4A7U6_9BURK|nr:LysM domain-containing protein [Massilia violaceinigra]UOD30084.1 LysM peptidoglycan-binding domain-containing protein [Massilia violaceinigra]
MTDFEKWQQGLVLHSGKPHWQMYDCEVKAALGDYNRHLSGTPGYIAMDWMLIKAMLWTESGGENPQWKIKPLQIGVGTDAGMNAVLGDKEGGDLIMPPALRSSINTHTIRSNPAHNIRGGIGYLLMRMANFAHKSIREPNAPIEQTKVAPGESLERIAKRVHSTVEVMRELNPRANILHIGDVVRFQKAKVEKVITGWSPINLASIAKNYNGNGDARYLTKLEFAIGLVRKQQGAKCEQ